MNALVVRFVARLIAKSTIMFATGFVSLGVALSVPLGVALSPPALAQATAFSAADTLAVRAVVQAQLDAFAVDDAERAFSFATPGIRQMMGNAQNFLAVVKTSYAVVHRPASVIFLKPKWQGEDAVQATQMTDAKGLAWLAIYTLQRQSDASWRISGCFVVPNQGRAT